MWPVVSLLRQAPRCQLMNTHGNRPGFLISCVRATAVFGGVSFESRFWEKESYDGVNTGLWSQRTRWGVCGRRPDMETPGWRLLRQRRMPAKHGFFQRASTSSRWLPRQCGREGAISVVISLLAKRMLAVGWKKDDLCSKQVGTRKRRPVFSTSPFLHWSPTCQALSWGNRSLLL